MNLISMKLFSTKVEFEITGGIDSEFYDCETIIQYNKETFDHVSKLVGRGYGRSKRKKERIKNNFNFF